jgi:hypothetical protein
MHGTYIKIIAAQQIRLYNIYNNKKPNLLTMYPAIWYNRICKAKQLTPKYITMVWIITRKWSLSWYYYNSYVVRFRIKSRNNGISMWNLHPLCQFSFLKVHISVTPPWNLTFTCQYRFCLLSLVPSTLLNVAYRNPLNPSKTEIYPYVI